MEKSKEKHARIFNAEGTRELTIEEIREEFMPPYRLSLQLQPRRGGTPDSSAGTGRKTFRKSLHPVQDLRWAFPFIRDSGKSPEKGDV